MAITVKIQGGDEQRLVELFRREGIRVEPQLPRYLAEYKAKFDAGIETLGTPLSVRTHNALANADIKYIGDLVQNTEESLLLKLKNFGGKGRQEVKEAVAAIGLSLGMKLEGWERPTKE